jgi:hypothetical protein
MDGCHALLLLSRTFAQAELAEATIASISLVLASHRFIYNVAEVASRRPAV